MLKSNLTFENCLSIVGVVNKLPKMETSPSGISHCQFWLEHRSTQIEVGFHRQVWCKLAIQISGNQLIKKAQSITVGTRLLIKGFLHTRVTNNGLMQTVLHAEQIEFLD